MEAEGPLAFDSERPLLCADPGRGIFAHLPIHFYVLGSVSPATATGCDLSLVRYRTSDLQFRPLLITSEWPLQLSVPVSVSASPNQLLQRTNEPLYYWGATFPFSLFSFLSPPIHITSVVFLARCVSNFSGPFLELEVALQRRNV